jgi:hypothetical protein
LSIRALKGKHTGIVCEREPVAWMVIDAAGYVSLFEGGGAAHEYAEFAHGPRPVHKLYRAKQEPIIFGVDPAKPGSERTVIWEPTK